MAKFKVGDIVVIKKDPQKKRRKIKKIICGDIVLEDVGPRFDECELEFAENSRACNSSNPVVRKAMNAAGQGTDVGNTLVKEYRDYARSQIQDLIQKVGDAQSYLFQQSERLKDRAAERGTDKDTEVIFVTHRKVDAALDAITAQLRRVLGY
jgi:hypothetical protein